MFILIAENKKGEQLRLTQNKNYDVVNIEGLNPPSATINTTTIPNFDGEIFNSARVNSRNIVLDIVINPNIENNRLNLYRYFHTKDYIKLYFKNGSRDVFTEGRIESIECDLFSIRQHMQISIICFQPYFSSINQVYTLSQHIDMLEFPVEFPVEGIELGGINTSSNVAIINAGEVTTGMIIKLRAVGGDVSKPIIYNSITRERLELTIENMVQGTEIVINTNKGERSIIKTENGISTNGINYFEMDSSWLQIEQGNNIFTYSATSGGNFLEIEFITNNKYEGV